MQPTEQKIQTSAGMETATQTVDRIKGQLGSTNIPISAIENNAPAPLQMPEMQLPQADIGGVRSAGQQIIDRDIAEKEAIAQQREVPVTETERRIQESYGILATEEPMRQMKEEKFGVNQYSQDLQKFQQNLRRQMAELDQFDIDNVNTIEQMRVDASRRDITKRTFGAQSAEAGIQMAVQRANMVASTRATIAGIEATQGNLQQATDQVDKALEAIYEPVRMQMQMEMFFLERNDKRFDSAQSQLAQAKMMGMQYELGQIQSAEDAAREAMQSGFVTADEIQQMVGLADKPQELRNLADSIIGRGTKQMRDFQIWAQKTQIGIQQAGLDMRREELAEQKLANAVAATQQMTKEGRAEVFASNEYKAAQVVSQYQNDLYNDIKTAGVTKSNGEIDWDAVSKNDALRYSIAVSLARASLPDISRFASAEDALQDTSLSQQVRGSVNRLMSGKGITPDLLKDAVRSLDARATSAYDRLEFRTNEVSQVFGVDQAVLPGVQFNGLITAPEASRFLDNIVFGLSIDDVKGEQMINSKLDNLWNQTQ